MIETNIIEYSKLALKRHKTRHGLVSIVIHWELYKIFKFDLTNKWYMSNPESVIENEAHKLLWDLKIQTDPLITAKRPDLVIVNKKVRTCRTVDFAVQVEYRVKLKKSEKK